MRRDPAKRMQSKQSNSFTHSFKVLCLCLRISRLEMERSFEKAVHPQSAVGSSTQLEERLGAA